MDFIRKFLSGYKPKYDSKIPDYQNTPEEESKQMRINVDILKRELAEFIDSEIQRLKSEIWKK
jgi:hypothetical protein